jgi:hypothetical protein
MEATIRLSASRPSLIVTWTAKPSSYEK